MMRTLSLALRELGPGPLLRNALYRAALAAGWYRWRLPRRSWAERPFQAWLKPGVPGEPEAYLGWRRAHAPLPGFIPEDSRAACPSQAVLHAADAIRQGRLTLFGGLELDLGMPPAWDRLPVLEDVSPSEQVDLGRHWSAYNLAGLAGDIKLLWEPARFGWAFSLVRAYRLSGDTTYAGVFWELFESWRASSPPNSGLHWQSAQEVACRTIALCYAVSGFEAWWADHPERLQRVIEVITAGAERIPPTMIYARAQDNNHLLVEAAALIGAGLLFPELRQAERWEQLGRRTLAGGLARQVFDDGGYVQHSSNYHRFALQAGLWSAAVAARCGRPLPAPALARLERMLDWLAAWMDPDTGRLPNFGPNDGALLLPLSDRPREDFRPTLQAGTLLLRGERALEPGPWDDLACWLGLLPHSTGEAQAAVRGFPTGGDFPQSGLHRLASGPVRGILRAVRFHGRPGHSDQLHFDLWWRGFNLACDAGSYLYNAPPPWQNPFSGAWCHNTLLVDGCEPMQAAGRFLWLGWGEARLGCRWTSPDGQVRLVEACRRGFRPGGIVHRRTALICGEDYVVIVDALQGAGEHLLELNWLLPDMEWRLADGGLSFRTPAGPAALEVPGAELAIFRAGEAVHGGLPDAASEPYGWHSPTYAVRRPALQIVCRARTRLPARLTSVWRLGKASTAPPGMVWDEQAGARPARLRAIEWDGARWEPECTSC